ncbi:hypothetical protein FQZ97_1070800 [compost metagenome]
MNGITTRAVEVMRLRLADSEESLAGGVQRHVGAVVHLGTDADRLVHTVPGQAVQLDVLGVDRPCVGRCARDDDLVGPTGVLVVELAVPQAEATIQGPLG